MDEPRKQRHLVLTVEPDVDLECPNDNGDGQWRLYSFGTRHSNYKDPEELGISPERGADGTPKVTNPGLRTKLRVGLAFWLGYFEHGNCLWFRRNKRPAGTEGDFRWDGVDLAGILVWEHPPDEMGARTYEDRGKDADAFLTEYTAWANGEGCGYKLETDAGEDVGGCWGFYELEWLMENVEGDIGKDYEGWPIVVKGELAHVVTSFHPIDGHEYVEEDELEDMREPEYAI